MARYERDFDASASEPLSPTRLLDLLGPAANGEDARKDAVACFLAGAEGWEEALQRLRGAFAEGEQGLTDDQAK